jgi:hypothetical protein
MNLAPLAVNDSTDDPRPHRHSLAAVLGSPPPPAVPLCTWVPPVARGPRQSSVGILHAKGRRALRLLGVDGIELPAGWRVQQDHQRRGLVVTIPEAAEHAEILRWTCSAASCLSMVDLTGWWVATVYAPSVGLGARR